MKQSLALYSCLSILFLFHSQNSSAASEMEFVQIPAGSFSMGSPLTEPDRRLDETLHPVMVSSFELQTTKVSEELFFSVLGYFPGQPTLVPRPGYAAVNNEPIDVALFIDALNSRSTDGYRYRLPTEAEWEYAVRAGTQTAYFFGDDDSLAEKFIPRDPSNVPSLSLSPNPWGLYDMLNGYELLSDYYGDYANVTGPQDPRGDPLGNAPAMRGCYGLIVRNYPELRCRSARRSFYTKPMLGRYALGFRLVRFRSK